MRRTAPRRWRKGRGSGRSGFKPRWLGTKPFQANSKFSQIEQNLAKPEQNGTKKEAWISLDSLLRIEPFQGLAPTPWALFSFAPLNPSLVVGQTVRLTARLLQRPPIGGLSVETHSLVLFLTIGKEMSKNLRGRATEVFDPTAYMPRTARLTPNIGMPTRQIPRLSRRYKVFHHKMRDNNATRCLTSSNSTSGSWVKTK